MCAEEARVRQPRDLAAGRGDRRHDGGVQELVGRVPMEHATTSTAVAMTVVARFIRFLPTDLLEHLQAGAWTEEEDTTVRQWDDLDVGSGRSRCRFPHATGRGVEESGP
jgi:hypothetical protein